MDKLQIMRGWEEEVYAFAWLFGGPPDVRVALTAAEAAVIAIIQANWVPEEHDGPCLGCIHATVSGSPEMPRVYCAEGYGSEAGAELCEMLAGHKSVHPFNNHYCLAFEAAENPDQEAGRAAALEEGRV